MKRISIIVFIFLILIFLGSFLLPKKNTVVAPTTPVVTKTMTFCNQKDLKTTLITQGAAGNIYGTVTLQNISSFPCTIQGNNFIDASTSAKNITIVHQAASGPTTISLYKGQTVYSQIHYPNGPQCQSGITQKNITFSYQISPEDTVVITSSGNFPPTIPVCISQKEITKIDVWSLSIKPLQ